MIEENNLKEKWKFDFSCPNKFEIDVNKLKDFLSKDKEAVLIFYGGEPLLEIEKIKEIIDKINVPFRMQTNGKLLNKLPINYIKKIDKILISLDGNETRTDYNRGEGTHKQVMQNIEEIKKQGYKGELIARMTISFADIFDQVLNLVDAGFNSVHWQLDAGFYSHDFDDDFKKFVNSYNESISKLITYWISEMENGRVIKLYPFIAIINSLLKNEKTKLRCGAGQEGYAISTDGKIIACPIMNCIEEFKAGDLSSNPKDLKKFEIDCTQKCEVGDLCGGRCLYWREAKLWPKKGDDLICETIKHYINELKNKLPKVKSLISEGIISEKDFEYERYFGPEIIP
jgi:uncharacterized protein